MAIKRKRDLLLSVEYIERYHQRRAVLVIHATLSLAFQAAMWVNWYASYAAHGVGFVDNFFADRFAISLVLGILLLGHFALMVVLESKDRMVVSALEQTRNSVQPEDFENEQPNSAFEDEGEIPVATATRKVGRSRG